MDYGFGAIFGCRHDQRDLDFARKYNLDVIPVVENTENKNSEIKNIAYAGSGIIINSEFLNGLKAPDEAILKSIEILEEKILEKKDKF